MSDGAQRVGIVVLGVPRSGTTLMRRVLDSHPSISCPGETCMLSAAGRFLEAETVADGLEFGVLNGLAFAGFDENDVLVRLRELVFGFGRELAARNDKPRWAEKTAVDVFHLPEVELLCGEDVQYIAVVRHGLDVACSIQEFSDRGFTYLRELHEYVARYPRPLEAFAHAWVDANTALLDLKARRPEHVHLLRYEDLVADPDTQLASMFTFLGEQLPDDLVATAMSRRAEGLGDWKTAEKQAIDSASVARWRKLPKGVVSRLVDICSPTLAALGYDPIETRGTDSQSRARRRYTLSMMAGAAPGKGAREPGPK